MTYEQYHAKVVDACVALMSGRCANDDESKMTDEELRQFFGEVCTYEEDFAEGTDPEEVAQAQWEAIT